LCLSAVGRGEGKGEGMTVISIRSFRIKHNLFSKGRGFLFFTSEWKFLGSIASSEALLKQSVP
jgi:hypothetical protein